ncbi:phage tail protein [[Clostridium] polysaccharolyticum]|uniref:Uncharacterized protein n=1 Tax=[Clostridium] polysaccharolyticum TaxID=29364 RepID=A0A1H9YHB5_9FIRM|nr:hypothetical protein [[Clostridium] polysaccharolyticum]SES68365.1 hypothetical protein SAMN04487772_10218 [[Clostridium] polysaccharolyticum]
MAQFGNMIMTDKGVELNAKVGNGVTLNLTKISTSSTEYQTSTLHSLESINVQQISNISSKTIVNTTDVKLSVVFNNAGLISGYYIKTLGLYANDPDVGEILYAVCQETSGNCHLPAASNTSSALNIDMVLTTSSSENVTVEVDPAGVVTLSQLNDAVNKKMEWRGEYDNANNYKNNDIVVYNDAYYKVNEQFTGNMDFSKVTFLAIKEKYDHFRIDLDFNASLNPCKGNGITYHGGCENFTQEDWVEWLGYKPCVLVVTSTNTQGLIETYLDQDDYSKNKNGETVDITSVPSSGHRSVMIKFHRIGILSNFNPYERKGSIRITNDMNASGYSYGAFNNGCRKNESFFVGAYPAHCENSKMYSLSGKVQTTDKSLSEYRACANAVGMNYGILDHIKLSLFHHLYIIQNGKIDGRMLSAPSEDARTTGTLNASGLNLNYVGTTARKTLGMEGNGVAETIDGIYLDNNGYLRICKDGYYNDTYNNYTYNGTPYLLSNGYMGSMVSLSEDVGILAYTSSGTSDNYFRCHVAKRNTGKIEQAMASNIFDTEFALNTTTAGTLTARLCFMN